jgi:hypothetical protein
MVSTNLLFSTSKTPRLYIYNLFKLFCAYPTITSNPVKRPSNSTNLEEILSKPEISFDKKTQADIDLGLTSRLLAITFTGSFCKKNPSQRF